MKSSLYLCAAFVLALVCLGNAMGQNALNAVNADGKALGACPLKQTIVKAEISGFLARVSVRQEFENNFSEKIEAVYTFPLPNAAAVDEMTMTIGETRIVRGKILKKEEAREIYEAARNNGQIAAILDQQRPNVFTQSVANILPDEKITIEISYVETLKYDAGSYEFVFPTVVAPRYSPAKTPDAQKISPPVAKGRAGHDFSLEVALDAGVPVENIVSPSHQIESSQFSANRAVVRLRNVKEIPDKDFVLRYDVSGKKLSDAVLAHRGDKGGFFTLILQPPDVVTSADVMPKEIVFVLDTSGSMEGFPIEKAKEAMNLALDGLFPSDTFNLITFAGDTEILFEEPVPATRENLAKAQQFLKSRRGDGSTEMMKAVKAALDPSDSKQHVRIVCFMTDGEVANENEIIAEVQNHKNARVFSFGIGNSVNRNLLDKIAQEGRGEAHYIGLKDDGSAAARRFHERVRAPLLTDIAINWNGLPVADVFPSRAEDLFSAKPVVVHGRYTDAARGTIQLIGNSGGQRVVREIPINLPEKAPQHDTLATLWARSRVAELTAQDYRNEIPEIRDAITNLAVEFRLLTQFISFVAVEEYVVTENGLPRRIEVPVESPEGTTNGTPNGFATSDDPHGFAMSGFVGRRNSRVATQHANTPAVINSVTLTPTTKTGSGQSSGNGSGGGTAAANSVTVLAAADVVEMSVTDQSVSGVVTSRQITELPLNGRNVSGFRVDGGDVSKSKSSGSAQVEAVDLPKPTFSPDFNYQAFSEVKVQVVIDESGKVTSSQAVSGHALLRPGAALAARNSKFSPTRLDGQPVSVEGFILYKYGASGHPSGISMELKDFALKLTPEQQKRRALKAKLAPTVFAFVNWYAQKQTEMPAEFARFVQYGKAEVRVYFADKTPVEVAELQIAGLEVVVDPPTAKFVIGRIAVEKLAALAELKAVQFIAAQNR